MNKLFKTLSALFLALMLVFSVIACDNTNNSSVDSGNNAVDYVSQLVFDASSGRIHQEVTVKMFIDGDTTHFNASEEVNGSKTIKARYLAVNTPESTGKLEPYGKTASRFTKSKLENAVSIIVESDKSTWEVDSTGERVLSWVWYKATADSEYRLLNLELLQEGLAIASNTANNSYGNICMKALNQAKTLKLYAHSGKADPEMFTGEAIKLSLKDLRANVEYYNGCDVEFVGVVTRNYNNGVYVEEYDEETGRYYAMYVYYGFNLNGAGLEILEVGNRVKIVGNLQLWEAGGTYQVTDLQYRMMNPDDPKNIQNIGEEGVEYKASYLLTTANDFANGKVKILTYVDEEDVMVEHSIASLSMNTSISMEGLKVSKIWTTTNAESDSKGAMTLTCYAEDGTKITVRTDVLKDENGTLITADAYNGKTIDVKGFVDYYDGEYQIKVLSYKDIIVH